MHLQKFYSATLSRLYNTVQLHVSVTQKLIRLTV